MFQRAQLVFLLLTALHSSSGVSAIRHLTVTAPVTESGISYYNAERYPLIYDGLLTYANLPKLGFEYASDCQAPRCKAVHPYISSVGTVAMPSEAAASISRIQILMSD